MVLLSLTVLYVSLRLTAADPPSELKHGGCIKVNECKCLMRDGSGLIDLGSVADEDGFIQRLKPLPSAPDVLLSFSPCLAFSEPERFGGTDCTGVAVCVSRRSGDRCSPNRSVTSSVSLSERALLQMWVESPCACPNACALVDVGPGTILLIILCISVTAYFIIGHSASLAHLKSSRGHYNPINKSKLIIANGYGTPLQDHVRSGRSGRVMVFRWLQKTVFGVRSAVS